VTFVVVGSVGDPEGTRTIASIILLLVALGLALVMLAVWLHRTTRPDPDLLAPLELMGERKWRRADPVWQRRRLDEIRPRGAVPMEPSIAPPAIDEAFDAGPSARGFDDLHGAGIPSGSIEGDETTPQSSVGVSQYPVDDALADADTPPSLERPVAGEFDDDDVDAEALAAAMAELDAELGGDQP
jgi:hypothetical protein